MEALLKKEKIQQNGAIVNMARNSDGVTPLMMAVQNGHMKIINTLLQHPLIEVNKANTTTGQDALYVARANKQKDICQLLLKAGATDKVRLI